METLLAHSFDYLSSYEPSKIRKGLRQVEGLLAQICLSKSKQTPVDRRRSMTSSSGGAAAPKALGELKDDPAFREFFKLQDGFQWNELTVTQSPSASSPVSNTSSAAAAPAPTTCSSSPRST
ncbi:hypothetical protein VTN02DRAFT_809 [Thermoascus thermophilus]